VSEEAAFGAQQTYADSYIYGDTFVKLSGAFGVWWDQAHATYKYNGYHVYTTSVTCTYFASLGYAVKQTWCGQGLSQSYPYTDYGGNFELTNGPWEWAKGMRQQIWADGDICCESSW
jgi:hypothetical protein